MMIRSRSLSVFNVRKVVFFNSKHEISIPIMLAMLGQIKFQNTHCYVFGVVCSSVLVMCKVTNLIAKDAKLF